MRAFKDTRFGDLTGETYNGNLNVKGYKIESLEGAPKEIKGSFNCESNPIKDPLSEIVKYGILAEYYWTDDGGFTTDYVKDLIDKQNIKTMDKRVTRPSMRTLLGLDK